MSDSNLVFPKLGEWLAQVDTFRTKFEAEEPFPLLVIDSFIADEVASGLMAEFPPLDQMPRSRDYMFGMKHELSSVETAGKYGALYAAAVCSEEFSKFLSGLAGSDLFVDPKFHGGGFHQGGDGSFLEMHADFNIHPLHGTWLRSINILLYLNREWDKEWGGELLVARELSDEPRKIAPAWNRAVIMATGDYTFHGYRRMKLPGGITRKSIAAYAYQVLPDGKRVKARTTRWAPQGAGVAKRLLAKYYGPLVKAKTKVAGSRTAKNR